MPALTVGVAVGDAVGGDGEGASAGGFHGGLAQRNALRSSSSGRLRR